MHLFKFLQCIFRFTTSIENIGNADFRPNVPKSHWVWHGCHQHYHSMEVCRTKTSVNSITQIAKYQFPLRFSNLFMHEYTS